MFLVDLIYNSTDIVTLFYLTEILLREICNAGALKNCAYSPY